MHDAASRPSGCRMFAEGNRIVVECSARSLSNLIVPLCFLVVCTVSWPSLGVLVLREILRALGLPIPAWFPGSGIPSFGLGGTIFMCLVFAPFFVVSGALVRHSLFCVFGRCRLSINGDDCVLFEGVGPLGKRRRFDANAVRDVGLHTETDEEHTTTTIRIDADSPIDFGRTLTAARRAWMLQTLQELLVGAPSAPSDVHAAATTTR